MKPPVKHLLVYADGHVEQSTSPLAGLTLVQYQTLPDGSRWRREFQITAAYRRDADDIPGQFSACTMVALEQKFVRERTAAEVMADDLTHRDDLLRRIIGSLLEP